MELATNASNIVSGQMNKDSSGSVLPSRQTAPNWSTRPTGLPGSNFDAYRS